MSFGSSSRKPVGVPRRCQFNAHQLADVGIQNNLLDIGCTWVRNTMPINAFYDDPTGLEVWKDKVRSAQAVGLKVLVLPSYEPEAWKTGTFTERYTRMAEFIAAVAADLPDCSWELFNEWEGDNPSFDTIFAEGGVDDFTMGERYGNFMNIMGPLLRPYAVKICTGGIGLGAIEGGAIRGLLSTMLRSNADAIGQHGYGFPIFSGGASVGQPRLCTNLIRAAGWDGEIWCTETGMGIDQIPPTWFDEFGEQEGWTDEDDMADKLQESNIMGCLREVNCDMIFIYNIRNPDDDDASWPLVRDDGSERPAFASVKAWNDALPSTVD